MNKEPVLIIKNNKKEQGFLLFFIFPIAVFFSLFSVVFWRMTVRYEGMCGIYWSDLPDHIEYFLETKELDYSLVSIISEFIYSTLGAGSIGFALYIAFLAVGTIVLAYLLLRKMLPTVNRIVLWLVSLSSVFFAPIYISFINPYLYAAGFSGSIWHNDTYTGMRFFVMLFLVAFVGVFERYTSSFGIKDFVIMTLLLFMANWAKPSFIIAFGPALLVLMICDLIKAKNLKYKNWILFGVTVLLSCLILIPQYVVLFETVSPDSVYGGEMTIGYGLNLYIFDHPLIALLQASAFPLAILILYFDEIRSNKFYLLMYLTLFFAILEYLFLGETGYRSTHQNMSWGSCLSFYLVFLVSSAVFIKHLTEYLSNKKANRKGRTRIIALSALLSIHFICGVVYFIPISMGACGYGF